LWQLEEVEDPKMTESVVADMATVVESDTEVAGMFASYLVVPMVVA